jgi:acylphosphatase
MNRRTYLFAGHVQGVGFRYTAVDAARGHAVTGYVRNLPDGRVELVMEGADAEMDGVVESLRRRMEGFIRDEKLNTSPATGEYTGFVVR